MALSVFVHIGPPKTATSAIQNWLQNNRKELISQGVFYPEHSLDENGVSSGNVLDVFDRTYDKKLIVSSEKVQSLIDACHNNSCHTLLLSSEFFFFQVDELLQVFRQVKFIAYIRFPLDVIESSYNQAVKRHEEVKPLGLPKEPKAYHLNLLKKLLNQYGNDRFILRFYEKDLLVNGDIVSDLIFSLSLDMKVSPSKVVNHSYSFEALEFKRWLNLFMHPDCQPRIDRFLQSYQNGMMDYSVIHPQKYDYYVGWFIQALQEFFTLYDVQNSQQYLNILKEKSQPPFKKQQIDIESFDAITMALVDWDFGLSQSLIKQAQNSGEVKEYRDDLYMKFLSYKSHKYQAKVWLSQIYYRVHHKLRSTYYRIASFRQDNSEIVAAPVDRFRQTLKMDDGISDGEIYRELALFCEQNGEIELAFRLMKKADLLRPDGPIITSKLEEYRDKLNLPLEKEKKRK